MSIRLKGFLAAFLVFGTLTATVANPSPLRATDFDDAEEVELFSAIDAGKVDVKVIAKNAQESKLIVTNKTKDHLAVNLPSSFALVPVLAQPSFGSGGSGMGGMGSGSSSTRSTGSSGSQSSGGGFGRSQSGGSRMLNLLPDQKLQDMVKTVCLEHGKKNPSPRVAYSIRPIDEVTDNKAVHLLCEKVGCDEVDQKSAQAAVWYLNNKLSWEELAAEHHVNATRQTVFFFTGEEIQEGMRLAGKTIRIIENEENAVRDANAAGPSPANSYE